MNQPQPVSVSIKAVEVEQPVHGSVTLVGEWAGIPYGELSVMLVYLKALAFIHQTHHWVSQGDPFYGDHLLFSRLYDGAQGEIDSLAEKAVGLGSTRNVDLMLQTRQLSKLIESYGMSSTIPRSDELAQRSLKAEQEFMTCVNTLVASLEAKGELTLGLENLLGEIVDTHEGHVYLLKQRAAK